jgi:uncharacterized protein YceH (UPF0502 family)
MRSVFFGAGSPESERPPSNFVIPVLNAEELRVLGCLMEKQFLTPDVYPMTLNGLVTACNQKTSREPVTTYDDHTVLSTLDALQAKGLSTRIVGGDNRVPKFRELLSEKTGLRVSELAVLCVMMLRGPQTVNELKDRTNRIHEFADAEEVESVLDRLVNREPQPLVVRLPRLTGQKEPRSMHLLAGPVNVEELAASPAPAAASRSSAIDERLQRIETENADLRVRIAALEAQFAAFKKQFE